MGASAGFKAKVELKVGGTQSPFTELKDADLKIDGKEIDVSTIDSEWGKSISGQKKWSMTLTCFYDPSDTVQAAAIDALIGGTDIEIYYYPFGKASGNLVFSGIGRVLGTNVAAKTDDAISLPLQIAGNGPLAKGTVAP